MKTKGTIAEMKDLLRVGQGVRFYDPYVGISSVDFVIKYLHDDCVVSEFLGCYAFDQNWKEIEILKDVDHIPQAVKMVEEKEQLWICPNHKSCSRKTSMIDNTHCNPHKKNYYCFANEPVNFNGFDSCPKCIPYVPEQSKKGECYGRKNTKFRPLP